MDKSIIRVNQSIYPPRATLERYLSRLYDGQKEKENGWLQIELEQSLAERLNVKHVFYTANGTMALLLSLFCIEQKGTVVMSAFSHPSTVDAVIAAGLNPKFCDVDPTSLCLDPQMLVETIDENTVAVLATHIYGNVCDHETISQITTKAGILLVYDASHAFGSVWKNKPLVSYGDVSALSLQAFKVFNSVEGGLIVTDDDGLAERIYRYRFFGKDRDNNFMSFGLNGKGSDLHAAVALANLEELEKTIGKRKANFLSYQDQLAANSSCRIYEYHPELTPNYAYLPIIFNAPQNAEMVIRELGDEGVVARRYFHPALNTLPFVGDNRRCPISEDVSKKVVCIPVHQELTDANINQITDIINGCCN